MEKKKEEKDWKSHSSSPSISGIDNPFQLGTILREWLVNFHIFGQAVCDEVLSFIIGDHCNPT